MTKWCQSPTDVFPNVKSSCGWGWGDAVSVGLIYWLLWDNVPRKASMGSSLVHSQEPANGYHFSKIPHLVMSDKIHTNLGCQFCLIVTLNWLLVGKLWIIELWFVIINIRHVCSGLRLYVNYIRKNNLKLPGDIFAATFQSKYWKYLWEMPYILSDNVLDKLLCLIILALNRSHKYRISCWNS